MKHSDWAERVLLQQNPRQACSISASPILVGNIGPMGIHVGLAPPGANQKKQLRPFSVSTKRDESDEMGLAQFCDKTCVASIDMYELP